MKRIKHGRRYICIVYVVAKNHYVATVETLGKVVLHRECANNSERALLAAKYWIDNEGGK